MKNRLGGFRAKYKKSTIYIVNIKHWKPSFVVGTPTLINFTRGSRSGMVSYAVINQSDVNIEYSIRMTNDEEEAFLLRRR